MKFTAEMKRIVSDRISKLGWTKTQLERKAGLVHGTAQRIHEGKGDDISDDNAEKLCLALGFDPLQFWLLSRGKAGNTITAPACDDKLAALFEWLKHQPEAVREVFHAVAKAHGMIGFPIQTEPFIKPSQHQGDGRGL